MLFNTIMEYMRIALQLPLVGRVLIEASITVHSSTDIRSVQGAFADIRPGKTHEDTRILVAKLRRKRNIDQAHGYSTLWSVQTLSLRSHLALT
jgi:hypothetical protein